MSGLELYSTSDQAYTSIYVCWESVEVCPYYSYVPGNGVISCCGVVGFARGNCLRAFPSVPPQVVVHWRRGFEFWELRRARERGSLDELMDGAWEFHVSVCVCRLYLSRFRGWLLPVADARPGAERCFLFRATRRR